MSAFLVIAIVIAILISFAAYEALSRIADGLSRLALAAEREERRRAAFDSLLDEANR